MIAVPFIFFFCALLWNSKQNGFFSIGSYILLLYSIITFMAIVLVTGKYYDFSVREFPIQPYAPLLFILLLSICIFPYMKKFPPIVPLLNKKIERVLDIMVYGYFAIFVLILMVSMTRIEEVLMSNALAEIRNEFYEGEAVSFYNHIHGPFRAICAICATIAPSSVIMTLITLFNVAFRKKRVHYHLMGFFGSMSTLLLAINIADRSNFVYWILLFGFGFFIFFVYFSKKQKIVMLVIIGTILSILLAYIMLVTTARFEMREGGAEGGIISYAGQSLINFCNFLEYVVPPNNLCVVFPLTTMLTGGDGYFKVVHHVVTEVNLFVAVFATFLGYIYSISGGFVMVMYVLVYNRISVYVNNHRKKFLCLGDLIRIWAASLTLVLGLFGYYYSFGNIILGLFLWIFLSFQLNPHRRDRKRAEEELEKREKRDPDFKAEEAIPL